MCSSSNSSSTQWRAFFSPRSWALQISDRRVAKPLVAVVLWISCMQLLLAMSVISAGCKFGEKFQGERMDSAHSHPPFPVLSMVLLFPRAMKAFNFLNFTFKVLSWCTLNLSDTRTGKASSCLRTHSANLPFSSAIFHLSEFFLMGYTTSNSIKVEKFHHI